MVYCITAYNSTGYYHADEHYQLIEFVGIKIGSHTADELAWEFREKLRSSVQPTLVFLIFKTLDSFSIQDPYHQAFVIRLLTALISLFAISYFVKKTRHFFSDTKSRSIYTILSYFLWFIPFLGVRFSSETWAGLFFLMCLAAYLGKPNSVKAYWIVGLLAGLCFLFRYQMIFAVGGMVLWILLIDKQRTRFFAPFFVSFILIVFLGMLCDWWFYGQMVIVPWNYFKTTILTSGGQGFGTSPWYFFFHKMLAYPGYFVGIPLIAALFFLLLNNKQSIFIWSFLPIIVVHSFIPHKEERFLFPMAFLFPIILVSGLQRIITYTPVTIWKRIIFSILCLIFLSLNLTGIIALAVKPAGLGRMQITRYIHNTYSGKKINLLHTNWANPYNPWNSLPAKFYLENDIKFNHLENLCAISDSIIDLHSVNLLVVRKSDLNHTNCTHILDKYPFKYKGQSIPKWVEMMNRVYGGFKNYDILVLYEFQP
jgi:GPI mannosyltransferase 3